MGESRRKTNNYTEERLSRATQQPEDFLLSTLEELMMNDVLFIVSVGKSSG